MVFQRIREEHGLAYTVQTVLSQYSDTGLFGIYAGSAPESAGTVLDLVGEELARLARELPSAQEVDDVVSQLAGGTVVGQLGDEGAVGNDDGLRTLGPGQGREHVGEGGPRGGGVPLQHRGQMQGHAEHPAAAGRHFPANLHRRLPFLEDRPCELRNPNSATA